MVVYYLIILLFSPLLVTCSSISSSSYTNSNTSFSSILCHPDESASLLGFINLMTINNPYYVQSWKKGSDCCRWYGIKCHPTTHHVVELDLRGRGLVGTLNCNSSLFHLRHLRRLDLTYIDFSQSTISPMFGSSFPYLESLYLPYCNFSGEVPFEISQLSKLTDLDLSPGSISVLTMKMSTFYNIISNMTHLRNLYLMGVNINSTIPPSITNRSSLTEFDLRYCNLRGELPANILKMPLLEDIDLRGNHDLYANFPLSNWTNSLLRLDLSYINFSSKLPSSTFISQYNRLKSIHLRGCSFQGQIPYWVWNIFTSNTSILSTNELDLSDNKFCGNINRHDIHSKFPKLGMLHYLNISHNYLTGSVTSILCNSLEALDLSNNMFDGPLPIPPTGILVWFSASNNNFTDVVPSPLCNLTSLEILDLSYNNLKGELPHCLGNLSYTLIVLNLGSNIISGTLPGTFSNCYSLEYLDLSDNQFEGLGPQSLAQCNKLQVLNLRNNKFREEFPQWLATLSNIQVLDLSWNLFLGSLALPKVISSPFPRLQVLDLSNNNFNGKIPKWYIESLKAMMNLTQSLIGSPEYLQSGGVFTIEDYYFYSTTLTRSGVTLKYDKIITTLATLDLSNNKFEGEIPNNLGKLVSIHGLNLSHNQLTGPIPRSLGSLTLLDFLDLSYNKLTGQIPQELTSLTSLGVFNVSENQLMGPIPQGKNFDTFTVDSYNGNLGLCGDPLPHCGGHVGPRQQPSNNDNEDEDVGMISEWKVAMMGCGFGTFVSFVWGCYMLSIERPLWLLKLVLILVDKVEKMFGRT